MNKRGWTIEQILELTENLKRHHEDYGQGRSQDFLTVCLNCKYAAEIIVQLLDQVKANENTCDHNWKAECLDLRDKCCEMEHHINMLTDERSKIGIQHEKLLKEKSDLDRKMGNLEGQVEAYKFIWNQRR